MTSQQDGHLPDVTDTELLVIPDSNLAPDSLTRLWTLKAAKRLHDDAAELIAELTGVSHRHLFIRPDQDPQEIEKKQQQHEQALRARREYDDAMQELRRREDRLLERLDELDRVNKEHLREIDARAITLHDGRRAYVDGDGFRDEQGRELQHSDAAEAAGLQTKTSSTWAEKSQREEFDKKIADQKEHILAGRRDREASNADTLNHEESKSKIAKGDKALEQEERDTQHLYEQYGNASLAGLDAAPARTTSVAGALDGTKAESDLSKQFSAGAAGQGRGDVLFPGLPAATGVSIKRPSA